MRWTLASVALLLASGDELAAQGKGIRFWNLTTATISSFQLSPAGKDTWGPNQTLNDRDKEVDHDERLRITSVGPGRYDAKVGYRDLKQCFVRDIEIKADAVFSIAPASSNHGAASRRCPRCVRLVMAVWIFAAPPHRVPFRMFTHPLCYIGRRTHDALPQRAASRKNQMRLFTSGWRQHGTYGHDEVYGIHT